MIEATMAATMSRRRPRRIAASLPSTLAHVPARPRTVSVTVGDSKVPDAPVLAATNPRNATPQPRSAFISSVWMQ